jgi:heterotetrameric sarcosine oxidase gamma subunit
MGKHKLPLFGQTSDNASVKISEIELVTLTQIAGWSGFDKAVSSLLTERALSLPGEFRTPFRKGTTTIWRTAPDRVLVRSQAPLDLKSSDELAVLDLSDARVCISLSGAGAAGLLSRVAALDFAEAAFPINTFVQTGLHHVGVLIDRVERDVFHVLIPTTWAVSLTGLLADHLGGKLASAA